MRYAPFVFLAASALVAIRLLELASIAVTVFTVSLARRGLQGFVEGMPTDIGSAGVGKASATILCVLGLAGALILPRLDRATPATAP